MTPSGRTQLFAMGSGDWGHYERLHSISKRFDRIAKAANSSGNYRLANAARDADTKHRKTMAAHVESRGRMTSDTPFWKMRRTSQQFHSSEN